MSQFEQMDLRSHRDWSSNGDYRRQEKDEIPQKETYKPIDMGQLSEAIRINSIRMHWELLVGSSMAKYVSIQKITPPSMHLLANNSMWMQEATMRKRELIEIINKFYGKPLISELQIHMQKKSFIKEAISSDTIDLSYQAIEPIDFNKIPLPKEVLESIEQQLASIKDPELKEMGRKLQIQNWKKNQVLSKDGYHRCTSCGKWIQKEDDRRGPKGPICPQCHHERYRNHVRQIKSVLKKHPTLKYDQMASYMPCTLSGFNQARKELIYFFMDKIHYGSKDPHHMYMLAQLITYKDVQDLEPQFVANLCAKYRSKFLNQDSPNQAAKRSDEILHES